MNQLQVKPQEYNLQPQEAENVLTAFAPKAIEFNALLQQYTPLLTMDIEEALEPAKELKKKLIEFEKEVNKLHKTHKEFSLNYGRFVDSNKNIYSVTEYKKKLDEIIKHEQLKKQAKEKEVADARHLELSKYMNDTSHIDLGAMQEEIYQAFLSTKKKEFEDAEQLRQSNEIIAKIYQSNTFDEFNYELFGNHIEERKKQIHASKLLEIERYISGDLSFELDTEELQQAYNNRLLLLDEQRKERVKSEMNNAYNNALRSIEYNFSTFVMPSLDAYEFEQEWKELQSHIQEKYDEKKDYIKSLLDRMPNYTIANGHDVFYKNNFVCSINSICEDHVVKYNNFINSELTPQQLYENWVNSLNISQIEDNRCIEVMARFEQFKRWALTL